LKEHPLQKTLYRKRPDWEIEELAESMRKGQDEPIEILSDGTIVGGHGRAEAARRLGWVTVRARVRHDLEEAGPEAIQMRLIEANLHRRQLSRLDMARSYRHLLQLAKDRKGRPVNKDQAERNLRELITARFKVSSKTLDRWLHVLDLPLILQEAVEDYTLPMT